MILIGDPHLGREFRAYVPLDRVGEREAMMMADFKQKLNQSDDMVVVVGDLFERPLISLQTLYDTATVIIAAATIRPMRKIIIMAGNHDLYKETEKKGSFHALALMLERVPNVYVLFKPAIIDDVAFFPWEYERTALEQLDDFDKLPTTAIGHWDLESFGDHTDHLCPAKALQTLGCTDIYSGHWHISGDYNVDGCLVKCTGSMQPMNHSEDPLGTMYVTLTKEEYEECDPKVFANKYVRVRLDKGEEITPPPTCLGFKLDTTNSSPTESERVNLGNFDLDDILKQAFTSFSVTKPVQSFIKENMNGHA